jgi:hypothetical protein
VGTRPHLMSSAASLQLLRRPDLWAVGARMLDPRWWRRVPPWPRPPAAYLTMRHETMFGSDPGARLGPDELIGYLEWCKRMGRLAR